LRYKQTLPRDWANEYAAERRARLLGRHGVYGNVISFRGEVDSATLFDVPDKMTRVFYRDLTAAGIAKTDSSGRAVDVHALRHTFGTMLAKSGVSLQVAQRAMRHSTPTLTANVYTHLDLGDIGAAVSSLPMARTVIESNAATAGEDLRPIQRPIEGRISVSQGAIPCTQDTLHTERAHEPKIGENLNKTGDLMGFESGGRCVTRTRDTLRVRQVL